MRSILELVILMCAMKMTPAVSYTAFNIAAIIYAIMRKHKALYPILFSNTLALHASFYIMQLFIDQSFFIRMMDVFKCSRWQFVAADLLIHALPSALFVASVATYRNSWRKLAHEYPHTMQFAGLYSLFMNLTWAIVNVPSHFDISNVYVAMNPAQWCLAWHACAVGHLGFGAILSKLVNTSV